MITTTEPLHYIALDTFSAILDAETPSRIEDVTEIQDSEGGLLAYAAPGKEQLIIASLNSYARHCANPLKAAEEDLLGQALCCLRDLLGNPAINHGKHDSATLGCLDEIRDILSQAK